METILMYKFPHLNGEEFEAMFQLDDIRRSRIYQEALEEGELEGKLETVGLLLQLGLSVENIARELNLSVEAVRGAAAKSQNKQKNGSSESST